MNTYKKTFYFNNTTFTSEIDTDLSLKELEKYYYDNKKKGEVVVEYVENKGTNIVDLKDVQIIRIERIDN